MKWRGTSNDSKIVVEAKAGPFRLCVSRADNGKLLPIVFRGTQTLPSLIGAARYVRADSAQRAAERMLSRHILVELREFNKALRVMGP